MINREELYAIVWSVPGTVAARRLGVSDSYLTRICKALDVPRPPRGWWAKSAAGCAPAPPPLAPAKTGFPDRWAKGELGAQPIKQFYGDGIYRKRTDGRHPLVERASRVYRLAKQALDGTHLVVRHKVIDLTVSEEALEDALSLANKLFTSLEERGHPVRIGTDHVLIRPILSSVGRRPPKAPTIQENTWSPVIPKVAIVFGVPVGLAILEINDQTFMRYVGNGRFIRASSVGKVDGITWDEWRWTPTRRLRLTAYSPHHPVSWERSWSELRRNSLVRQVELIVAELESIAQTLPHADFFLGKMRLDSSESQR